MQHYTGISLRTRLYGLVLIAFIPVSALIFYIASEQKSREREAILQRTMALARAVADEENRHLESTRRLLATISDFYLLDSGNSSDLSILLTRLLKQSEGYIEIGILAPNGRLIASSNRSGIDQDYSDGSWLSDALRSQGLVWKKKNDAGGDEQPLFYFTLPVFGKGRQVAAIAFAEVDLNRLNRAILNHLHELPGDSQLILVDETQGTFRYDTDTGQWVVSRKFASVFKKRLKNRQTGVLTTADSKGITWIFAFAPLSSSFRNHHTSVVLGIPEAKVFRTANRLFTRNILLLIVSVLLALLSMWWASNFFVLGRVREMVRVSRELAAGNLDARIGKIGVHDELSYLAGLFDEMAASLQTRIRREEQVRTSLEQSREQLRNLTAYQEEVREQDRIRIAREIHDQFGQSLTILKMDLAWLKKRLSDQTPGVDEKLAAMSQVMDDAMKNLHTITGELRPVILDDFGLAAAIEWQAEEFENRTGIVCRVENDDFEPELSRDQTTALFRIFQETLTNILRHAQASEVVVRLDHQDRIVRLQVMDNGTGITEGEINDPKSYGLLGIRERLYPWNGQASFEGTPGQGTCVTIRLPMTLKGEPS